MRISLDFEPCGECSAIMAGLCSPEMMLAGREERAAESARFLRHLTYNHAEAVSAITDALPGDDGRRDFYR
ncbi:MAG: hypothetical protein MPJ06_00710 [Nitrosopumilus sp.]|nr:hypothetical protein [Nitrosopumilus sp.]MDA7942518.1 hypothetical protein [Nitrosopumilus sp.]